MKKILLLFIFSLASFALKAQSEIEKQIRREMWDNSPPEFKSITVPEKWKNESAVILAASSEYIGDMSVIAASNINRFYVEKVYYHFRVKLLDKAAVTDFSEISFDRKSITRKLFGRTARYHIIGIKVIKPDGSEKEVDLSGAVKADGTQDEELKIPVPNLETGDVIDYYTAFRNEIGMLPEFNSEIPLASNYPIVDNTIRFSIPSQFTFFVRSLNGAPSFTKAITEKNVIYTLKDSMRDKTPETLFTYEFRTAPHFRFKISGAEKKTNTNDVQEVLNSFASYNVNTTMINSFFKEHVENEKDPRKIAAELYYLLRNPLYRRIYFGVDPREPLEYDYTPELFFVLFSKTLEKFDIEHELMLAPSRHFGPLEQLVGLKGCDLIIKINTAPPFYITRPFAFTLPEEIPHYLEGMEAVNSSMSRTRLGISRAGQNSTTTSLALSLNLDAAKVTIGRTVTARGHHKDLHQRLIFTNYDYLKEYDLPKYQSSKVLSVRSVMREYEKEKLKLEQRREQDYFERNTRITEYLEKETDLKISDYKNLSIKSIGMWQSAPDTEYSDEMNLEGITKKAGPNTILEIGKLIGKQVILKDEDRNRTTDIYVDGVYSVNHIISFKVPDGYTVEGWENLNITKENGTGGFVSTAIVNENTVEINTRKFFTRNYYTRYEWSSITDFLDAAQNFYNSKLLLKKVSP